jgi:drug/metabolite transporter (DMT)-like permease
MFPIPDLHDTALLLLLSLGCTLLPFAVALVALRHLSAYVVQMTTNLEPVYAIVLAMILLHEQRQLDPLFYLGVAIVLGTVFLQPWITRQRPALPPGEILGTAEAKNLGE